MKIQTNQLRIKYSPCWQSSNPSFYTYNLSDRSYNQGLKMRVLKYSVNHFSTAHASTNSRTLCVNIKIEQNFYIDSIEANLKIKKKAKTCRFFYLTMTRKVLTTISLFLGVSNVKLTVWRPNSNGSIRNVTAEEEPPSRFLNLQLCVLDPALAESPKVQIPFPAAILTQNWNVERF